MNKNGDINPDYTPALDEPGSSKRDDKTMKSAYDREIALSIEALDRLSNHFLKDASAVVAGKPANSR